MDPDGAHRATAPASPTSADEVRALLRRVLAVASVPGIDALRTQAEAVAEVVGPVTMLRLGVAVGAPRSSYPDGPVLVDAEVADADGELIGELRVWVQGGFLDALEFAWWSDEPPTALPLPAQVTVTAG